VPGAALPDATGTAPAIDPILGDSSKAKIDRALPLAAQVGDTAIYQRDVDATLAKLGQRKLDHATLPSIKASVLDQLITKTLLDKFLAAQKMTPTPKEVDAAVEQLKENLKKQNNAGVLGRVDDASLRDFVTQQLGLRRFVAANQTDDSLRAVFKALHEQFDGTERRVSHILLRPEAGVDPAKVNALREQAVQLRDDIINGRTTFDAAAEKYSAGPSRHQHGDLGFIPPQGVMMPEFSQVAFALKPGEISQPVLTAFGYHLIKVTDVKPGKKSFEDVKDAVKARFPDFLMRQVTMLLKQKYGDKVVFNESYPHYKPGTTELVNPQAMSSGP
jgi:parvulin-like peptidyl-prolyl isomerase